MPTDDLIARCDRLDQLFQRAGAALDAALATNDVQRVERLARLASRYVAACHRPVMHRMDDKEVRYALTRLAWLVDDRRDAIAERQSRLIVRAQQYTAREAMHRA